MRSWICLALGALTLAACSLFEPGSDKAPAYIVFFHYDTAVLSPDARVIVDQAAQAIRDTHPAIVEVAGYSDPSGPKQSRHLAEPRMVAVEQALMQ